MKYTIQSTELSVEVNSTGLELSSIKSTQTGQEYLWQGDPAIWGGQAPVLFPIVGGLKEGFTLIEGLKYQMPKHGIVRNCDKTKLLQQTDSSLWFRLSSDQETLASYPYQFQLDMIFTLAAKTLTIEHHISNLGTQTMYYSLGAHPAFNCPMLAGEVYEDYLLEFAEAEIAHTQLVDPSGLIGLDQKLVLDNTNVLQLHGQLFDGDALIFKHLKSREVTLAHKVRGAVLSVNFEDFDYLGIWAKSGGSFVCLEPWLGIGDSVDSNQQFKEKDGIQTLAAGETTFKSYSIRIME